MCGWEAFVRCKKTKQILNSPQRSVYWALRAKTVVSSVKKNQLAQLNRNIKG